jgi:hypothetical protein
MTIEPVHDDDPPTETRAGPTCGVWGAPVWADQTAWSLDDTQEYPHHPWRTRALWTGLLVLLCAASVAVAWFSIQFATQRPVPVPPVTVSMPTPETVTPPPVTITPPPVTSYLPPPAQTKEEPPPPAVGENDQRMLDRLASQGYTIDNRAAVLRNAHGVCEGLRRGASLDEAYAALQRIGMDYTMALMFVGDAMLSYPDCA